LENDRNRLNKQLTDVSAILHRLKWNKNSLKDCKNHEQMNFFSDNDDVSIFSHSNQLDYQGIDNNSETGLFIHPHNLILAPFCVACQSHTANVAILNCGHVCLCKDHAEDMLVREQLGRCPLCQQKCTGICNLKGIC
jgi:hypothetical protein